MKLAAFASVLVAPKPIMTKRELCFSWHVAQIKEGFVNGVNLDLIPAVFNDGHHAVGDIAIQ
jgi:hypothetical protein